MLSSRDWSVSDAEITALDPFHDSYSLHYSPAYFYGNNRAQVTESVYAIESPALIKPKYWQSTYIALASVVRKPES